MARNTNRQGADFELAVMRHLARCPAGCEGDKEHRHPMGYAVLRSSGSRGAVDVIGVWDDMSVFGLVRNAGQHLLFIQCKISNPLLPPAERRAVMRMATVAGAVPLVAYKAKEGRLRPIRFRELTGTGPKEWRAWSPPEAEES